MSVRPRAVRAPEAVVHPVGFPQTRSSAGDTPIVKSRPIAGSTAGAGFSSVDFGQSRRMSLMLAPRGRGAFREQFAEVFASQEEVLGREAPEVKVTSQTLFLRNPDDVAECRRLIAEQQRSQGPVTNLVLQAPCCGAALALEAWAIGGPEVRIEYLGPHTVRVEHPGAEWTYCGGIQSDPELTSAWEQTRDVLAKLRSALERGRSGFEQVVRTWFYLGGITNSEAGSQRYKELNRARSEFYRELQFHCSPSQPNIPQGIYPASTGIGMQGTGLAAGCVALRSRRSDSFLLALENPQQTPAYAYHPRYSPHSPKFSRAVALVLGQNIITWLSGTASVVHSVSRHPADIQKQTEQTIENMERLISTENFAFHGVKRAGARLSDLAKVRIYLKRPEDFAACKAICDRRFGGVPAIYAVADVCRPELLVEIEGVAFTKRAG